MTKTVLVTGASSGIGRATAQYFSEHGWNVIATMRTPEKENELISLPNVLVTKIDVTDDESIKNAFAEGINKFSQIDVVVNNAGYGLVGPIEAISMDQIRHQYEVNVFGLYAVTKEAIPHFREQKSGLLINVSSVGGRIGYPFNSFYQSTKFAVEGFTESIMYEMAGIGVTVKLIEPGAVATNFTGRSMELVNDPNLVEYQGMVQKVMQTFANPDRYMASPTLIAERIYHAATDGTSQLRYPAGLDAEQFLEKRGSASDEEVFGIIKQRFSLN